MARSLIAMGSQGVLAFCAFDGTDEISPCCETAAIHATTEGARTFVINPADFQLPKYTDEQLAGGDAAVNAKRAMALLQGEKGAYRDAVLLNSAACFVVTKTVEHLRDGLALAADLVDSGRALATLKRLAELSRG